MELPISYSIGLASDNVKRGYYALHHIVNV
jgi:hypothetical protein